MADFMFRHIESCWMLIWESFWCWERLRAEEEDITGWDGWMASIMQWTWTWANFGRWWGTGWHGVLQSMDHKESDTTWWLNNSSKLVRAKWNLVFHEEVNVPYKKQNNLFDFSNILIQLITFGIVKRNYLQITLNSVH